MPRSLSRRTQDALLLSSLTMAVIVGKMYAAATQTPRAHNEFRVTERAGADAIKPDVVKRNPQLPTETDSQDASSPSAGP